MGTQSHHHIPHSASLMLTWRSLQSSHTSSTAVCPRKHLCNRRIQCIPKLKLPGVKEHLELPHPKSWGRTWRTLRAAEHHCKRIQKEHTAIQLERMSHLSNSYRHETVPQTTSCCFISHPPQLLPAALGPLVKG